MRVRFGKCELDSGIPELRRDGDIVHIEPGVFDVLVHLIKNRDRVVSKDDLVAVVWQRRIVSDAAITSRINQARQAVGDDGRSQSVIQTLPKRGFRFVADLDELVPEPQPSSEKTPASSEASILVLPFTDLTPAESNYLAEGLTEDLIVALTRYNDVRVISLNTAQRVKERQSLMENPMAEVAADYLVSGTVRVGRNRVRVTVQLSERKTGASIFADQFDRELADIFAVQDEIVQSLAGCLPWRLLDDVGRRLATDKNPRLSSYQAFVRANFEAGVNPDIHRVEADYRSIIQKDPEFGPARGALAFLLGYKVFFTGQQSEAEIEESLLQARRAIKLSAENERVLAKCSMVFQFAGQFSVARRLAEQAISINPNSTDCTHFYATILAASGEAEGAMEYHQETMRLDPLFPEEHYEGMIEALFLLGRYEEALDLVERWSSPPCHGFAYGAVCSALAGQEHLAAKFVDQFNSCTPGSYSNEVFLDALVRYHVRPEDRDHWRHGFCSAGLSSRDAIDR